MMQSKESLRRTSKMMNVVSVVRVEEEMTVFVLLRRLCLD